MKYHFYMLFFHGIIHTMLYRKEYTKIQTALKRNPICFLAGPRQVGKTTLARQFLNPDSSGYFDLEDPASSARLEAPKLALNQDLPLTVIDEIQIRPDLFSLLRVLADAPDRKTRWLILGSASPGILKGVAESLAGRVEMVELSGFSWTETAHTEWKPLLFRGGFPRSWLATNDTDSLEWRRQFITTILSRDLPGLGVQLPLPTLQRLWAMMAHWHGQIWNASEPARTLGVSETTIHRLTDFFEGLYFIRQLRPWHSNSNKRQIKRPKLYIRDSGLCGVTLGIKSFDELVSHPKGGALWEGFVIEELIRHYQPQEAWFWATHNGAELDLLLIKDGKRLGFEIKLSDAPRLTPSMKIALTELELNSLTVIHGGNHTWQLADSITACPLGAIVNSDLQSTNPD
jgi:predicted AAA+ superfamily ATPase